MSDGRSSLLHDLKLKAQLFAPEDVTQVVFPKLSGEAQGRPLLIEVNQKFNPKESPQVRQRDVRTNGLEADVGIEREEPTIGNEILERVAVKGGCGG